MTAVIRKSSRPEYHVWAGMKARCYNRNQPGFRSYGGRGIKVCARWLESFGNFFEDMGPRPPGHSIDRINNDGDYEPGNCRWATQKDQMRNTRRNVRYTIHGESGTVGEWADRGVNLAPFRITLSPRLQGAIEEYTRRTGMELRDIVIVAVENHLIRNGLLPATK